MNPKLKILIVSDVVEPQLYEKFDSHHWQYIDLILSCGDLPPEYLTFLFNKLNVPLFYVCGNHDIRYLDKPPRGCENLHGKLIHFRGINILGLNGSMWYSGGPYQYTESQMRLLVRKLRFSIWRRGGVDLVFTHAPPRRIHDADDLCHRGFETYCWLIHKYRPRYFLHGHIHRAFNNPSERITMVGTTMVINTYGHYILEVKEQPLDFGSPETAPTSAPSR